MERHGYLYELLLRAGLSDFGATTGEFLLVRPVRILGLFLLAGLVSRIGSRAARRFVASVHARSPLRAGSPRAAQRAATVGDAVAGVLRVVVWSVAGLVILGEVGVDLRPLLAGAGIVGLAVGFGAQSLVRDFLSGLFILAEDQFGVGDVVDLGERQQGVVEEVTLRVTRLRAVDGTVWYVPNGEVRSVGNTSMEWSKAVVDVLVGAGTDLAAALGSVADEADAFAADEQWAGHMLEAPEVWGAQSAGPEGITLRVTVKTSPGMQFALARALRQRLITRLRVDGHPGGGALSGLAAAPSTAASPRPAPRSRTPQR